MTRAVTVMTLDDAEHIAPEDRAATIAKYPAYEREARIYGRPSMGSGRIFTHLEESLTVEPMPIPEIWVQINGLDFGFGHPFAAANLAWDRDADIIYVTKTYKHKGADSDGVPPVVLHAAALRPWGEWIPCAWPHDGLQHDKGSGEQLAEQYRAQHLEMLYEHATHESGGFGVEAGIAEMDERMGTGRFKVFSGNAIFFNEYRLYHREDGKIIKLQDDVLSAVRYATMMKRFAIVKPKPVARGRGPSGGAYGWMGG